MIIYSILLFPNQKRKEMSKKTKGEEEEEQEQEDEEEEEAIGSRLVVVMICDRIFSLALLRERTVLDAWVASQYNQENSPNCMQGTRREALQNPCIKVGYASPESLPALRKEATTSLHHTATQPLNHQKCSSHTCSPAAASHSPPPEYSDNNASHPKSDPHNP